MNTWTVIGYYSENLQPWAGSFEADTFEDAERMARDELADSYNLELVVVGVVAGEHAVYGGDEA